MRQQPPPIHSLRDILESSKKIKAFVVVALFVMISNILVCYVDNGRCSPAAKGSRIFHQYLSGRILSLCRNSCSRAGLTNLNLTEESNRGLGITWSLSLSLTVYWHSALCTYTYRSWFRPGNWEQGGGVYCVAALPWLTSWRILLQLALSLHTSTLGGGGAAVGRLGQGQQDGRLGGGGNDTVFAIKDGNAFYRGKYCTPVKTELWVADAPVDSILHKVTDLVCAFFYARTFRHTWFCYALFGFWKSHWEARNVQSYPSPSMAPWDVIGILQTVIHYSLPLAC
jgi:hypothetical protein